MKDPFYGEFRARIRTFVSGVHLLGNPVPAAVQKQATWEKLTDDLREFYRSFDGARLFIDTAEIWPFARLRLVDSQKIVFGQTADHTLALQAGRVVAISDGGDQIQLGSSFSLWLSAFVARESLLFASDGEWKDVFDDSGDLSESVKKKRWKRALEIDPSSAMWHLEAAEWFLEKGDKAESLKLAEKAVACDPEAAEVWDFLAGIHLALADWTQSERALLAALKFTVNPENCARRYARLIDFSKQISHVQLTDRLIKNIPVHVTHVVKRWLDELSEHLRARDEESAAELWRRVAPLLADGENKIWQSKLDALRVRLPLLDEKNGF